MAFFTIHITPGVPPSQRREAARAGWARGLTDRDHRDMLERSGFRDVAQSDVTADYLRVIRAWYDESASREPELRAALGDLLFEDRQSHRCQSASLIERGLLRRSFIVARVL